MSNTFREEGQAHWAALALEQAPFVVCWLTAEARIFSANTAATKLLGYSHAELTESSLFDLDESLTKKVWKSNWQELLQQGILKLTTELYPKNQASVPMALEMLLIPEEGSPICCLIARHAHPQTDLELQLREANLLLEKIVEERSEGTKMTVEALKGKQAALSQLRQLQQQTQLILDSVGEGIYGLDTQGHTTFVNPAAQHMVGYSLEELLGKPQHAIIHHSRPDGSHYEAINCPIYAAFRDGQVHQVDNEVFWRKDGTSFPVEYLSTPIRNDQGELLGAVVSFRDISRRKQAEEAIHLTNQELQVALATVEQLTKRLEQENQYLQQEIKLTHNFEEIISQSSSFKRVLTQVEQVAHTDASVLILGESGTGKELIARAIHNISDRKDRAMVKVNCAALPANLIESELFGHERGAFTGAVSRRIGRFELADGGTIFLDEVGEIPLELQSKLLRVLQEGEFERLGNPKTLHVDVRVIAATNRNLLEGAENGTFREDLYYRLNVFPLEIPPLRERQGDIPLLVHHFLMKYGTKFGKKIEVVTQNIMDDLIQYSWPGNVRELENVIERAVIITRGNKLKIGDSLPKKRHAPRKQKIVSLEEQERNHILKALEYTSWRVSGAQGAAQLLGIKRTTLEARMKKLQIKRPT